LELKLGGSLPNSIPIPIPHLTFFSGNEKPVTGPPPSPQPTAALDPTNAEAGEVFTDSVVVSARERVLQQAARWCAEPCLQSSNSLAAMYTKHHALAGVAHSDQRR
jgi:hypothetical protein